MTSTQSQIVYTFTDEAPALATRSLLPIIRSFLAGTGIEIVEKDISLAGRILAQFSDQLSADQQTEDALAELGRWVLEPNANIIKLPNISASIPQLTEAISELQRQGYAIPNFPSEPTTSEEMEFRTRYAKVLGSAVNPVLREGNSDRRVADPVKEYAQKNPHSMGSWSSDSKSKIASMHSGDFFSNECSHRMDVAGIANVELIGSDGSLTQLRDEVPLQEGEVIDATVMRRAELRQFIAKTIEEAREQEVLFSLHLKATMMKVSDPIIFGHVVHVFFEEVFEKHSEKFQKLGVHPNFGLGDLLSRIEELPEVERDQILADLQSTRESRPGLAMVDSDRDITNLHVPSDVIIDASMPAAVRSSGKMWNAAGELQDTIAMIPDRSYAGIYQVIIDDCKENGAFDVTTMGNVSNVGLMAQKAEEYGSHDKTFEIPHSGRVRVSDGAGNSIFEHAVETGDIWRMCQTKDAPIIDWVRLAVSRARATGATAIFWLDENRAHDRELITRVRQELPKHDTQGLDIQIHAPVEAMRRTCARCRAGDDTITVTGNVLRDYLTDLFPILELGTSAKMLSIVPLLAGGGLFETGAGGSAPKHVQQFVKEGHLRWDSLGEFLALAVSIETLAEQAKNSAAKVIGESLIRAVGRVLDEKKSPLRKVNELDNRGSHFYLAMYWAQELASQEQDSGLADRFRALAEGLTVQESKIIEELNAAQGSPVDIGGYYHPDTARVAAEMRPSATFNAALEGLVGEA